MNAVWWLLWTAVAVAVVVLQTRRALREPLERDRIVREAHKRATAARKLDDLELIYSLPEYDPAWEAGMERLWDAIRDEQQKGDQT